MKNVLISALEKEAQRIENELNEHTASYKSYLTGQSYRIWWATNLQMSKRLEDVKTSLRIAQEVWDRLNNKVTR